MKKNDMSFVDFIQKNEKHEISDDETDIIMDAFQFHQ